MIVFQFILRICGDNGKNPTKSSNSLIRVFFFFQLLFAVQRRKPVLSQRGCGMMPLDQVTLFMQKKMNEFYTFRSLEIRCYFILLFENKFDLQYPRRNTFFDFN